jgi:hypothetical protein
VISTTLGQVFGGYTSVPWPSAEEDLKDGKSFIYSVSKEEKYPIKKDHKRAVRKVKPDTEYLLIYGIDDLYIMSNSNTQKGGFATLFGTAYEVKDNG